MEAELCKLMTNAWRYIQFAIVNQFYMIASRAWARLRSASCTDAGTTTRAWLACRARASPPGRAWSRTPCNWPPLAKTPSCSATPPCSSTKGLPAHLIELARRQVELRGKTVGILGMAFKGESDDTRDSLSFKLRKLLILEARRVLCTDPYAADADFVPLERVMAEADVLLHRHAAQGVSRAGFPTWADRHRHLADRRRRPPPAAVPKPRQTERTQP